MLNSAVQKVTPYRTVAHIYRAKHTNIAKKRDSELFQLKLFSFAPAGCCVCVSDVNEDLRRVDPQPDDEQIYICWVARKCARTFCDTQRCEGTNEVTMLKVYLI